MSGFYFCHGVSHFLFTEAKEVDADGNGDESDKDDQGIRFGEKSDARRGFFASQSKCLEDRADTVGKVGAK